MSWRKAAARSLSYCLIPGVHRADEALKYDKMVRVKQAKSGRDRINQNESERDRINQNEAERDRVNQNEAERDRVNQNYPGKTGRVRERRYGNRKRLMRSSGAG